MRSLTEFYMVFVAFCSRIFDNDDDNGTFIKQHNVYVFQAGLEGDPAAPGESRTPPGPLHPPSSPEMDDANSKRQATR